MKSHTSRRKAEGKTGDGRSRRRGIVASSKSSVVSSSGSGKRPVPEKGLEERVEKPAPKSVPEKPRSSISTPYQRPPSPLKPAKPMTQPPVPQVDEAAFRIESHGHGSVKMAPPAGTCDVFSYLVEDSTPSTPFNEDCRITCADDDFPDAAQVQSPPGKGEPVGTGHGVGDIARNPTEMSRAFSDADTLAGRDSFGAGDAPAPRFPGGTLIDPTSAISDHSLASTAPRQLTLPTHPHEPPPWMRTYASEHPVPGMELHMPTHINPNVLSNTFDVPDPNEQIFAHTSIAQRLCSRSAGASQTTPLPVAIRKFEHLNHRVLLHLQDEITQLEGELQAIDQALDEARHDEDGDKGYYSERDALRWRYFHVMGKLEAQLAKYYHALSSSRMLQSCDKPSQEDLQQYRSYLDRLRMHMTASQLEKHVSDLVCLRPKEARGVTDATDFPGAWVPIPPGISTIPQLHVASVAALFLLPMLLFNFISSIPGRFIVVVGTAAGAAALLMSTSAFRRMSMSDWTRYGVMYIGFMALLAMITC